jgi:hypothetical protein
VVFAIILLNPIKFIAIAGIVGKTLGFCLGLEVMPGICYKMAGAINVNRP